MRWLGWSWLLWVLPTDAPDFKRWDYIILPGEREEHGSPWCSVICWAQSQGCSWPFQRLMFFSESSYLAIALVLPFQKRLTKGGSKSSAQILAKRLQIPSAMGPVPHMLHPGEQTPGWSTPCSSHADHVGILLIENSSSLRFFFFFFYVWLFFMTRWRMNSHVLCGKLGSFCTSDQS